MAQLAHWESQVERRKSLRQLDDLVGTGTWKEVMALYQATRDVCSFIGVRLASEDEPDKAFGPSKQGTVLGIFYDLSSWEWKLCPEKANKILELLFEVIEKDRVENSMLKKLLGKMNHYAAIFSAKFERSFIQKLHEDLAPNTKMIGVTANAKSQAGFWIRAIKAASKVNKIPNFATMLSAAPLIIHGDAAGGMSGGYGALSHLPDGSVPYVLGTWEGKMKTDKKLLGKLTFLEALAALNGLLMVPDGIRNKHVQVIRCWIY